jgi:hypothetical protein
LTITAELAPCDIKGNFLRLRFEWNVVAIVYDYRRIKNGEKRGKNLKTIANGEMRLRNLISP